MKNYSLFPPAATNVVIHSSLISYLLAAIAGYGPLTGFDITRVSSSEVSVAAGTYSNGAKLKTIVGATALGTIAPAAAGKERYDAIILDCDTDTIVRVAGTEAAPDDVDLFLSNENPKPPAPTDTNWAVLYFLRITEDGLDDITIGDYCTHGIADVRRPQAFAVDGTTLDVSATTGVMSVIQSGLDHGSIGGLGDDDHSQYLNTVRHDTTTRHTLGTVVPHDDHGALSGLGDDDHSQYHTDGRGDARYAQISAGGWISAGETWTYASADDPTFTFTVNGDKTSKYSPGMRIKVTQSSTVVYFIITKVTYSSPNTTITVYGGTDYDLADSAISDSFYSFQKAPFGFPLSPDKWSIQTSSTSQSAQSNPVASTWYNLGSLSISVPIGAWKVYFTAIAQAVKKYKRTVCYLCSLINLK
jgi:hypothetical protein